MTTITVRLADVPRDVLVDLVDHGPSTALEIAERCAPPDTTVRQVQDALRLLAEMRWAALLADPASTGWAWRATDEGTAAVAAARAAE